MEYLRHGRKNAIGHDMHDVMSVRPEHRVTDIAIRREGLLIYIPSQCVNITTGKLKKGIDAMLDDITFNIFKLQAKGITVVVNPS